MQAQPLGLAILLIPAEFEPIQPVEYGIELFLRIASHIRVVDSQDHGSAILSGVQSVENKGARAADVKIAGRRGRKTDSHMNAQYNVYGWTITFIRLGSCL
jgi:hypothetical protein